ncbi:MAG: class I SAM-dependent RNA methyltransferase [Myxococcota bacterium]|nr:class I SAM-dependent RNA methyltransferase [Myxococcota bacterium]
MEGPVLRIESLAAGGDGVARAPDGRVVFVPFSAPGDRVRVRFEEQRRRFARARVTELVEASPARVEPRCPAFGECGGCSWQHVAYSAQAEAKRGIVVDALERIGGLEVPQVELVPCPSPYAYRMRARLLAEGGRVGYRRRASHALRAVDACPVLVPALEAELARLASRPPPGDGEWELACAGDRVRAVPLDGRSRDAGSLTLEVAGERLRVSPGVFAQANALLLEPLVERVMTAVGSGTLAVELFAGAGLFTLPLARRFARVLAVEGFEPAASDLRANLAAAGLASAEVVGRRVEEAAPSLVGLSPEVVLLDPPRTGLPAGGVALLVGLAASRVAYLSCDPATLARDLRELCPQGYRLAGVEVFDLFPQTPHVEALATLQRSSP